MSMIRNSHSSVVLFDVVAGITSGLEKIFLRDRKNLSARLPQGSLEQ